MVSIQHDFPPLTGLDSADIDCWLAALSGIYTAEELVLLRQACEFAAQLYIGQNEMTGMPLLQHALGTASILCGMRMDCDAIAASLLHAAPDCLADSGTVLLGRFGRKVAALVEGISKVERIRLFSQPPEAKKNTDAAQQIESLRKMLLAMVEDIRVVIIKLAERTHTLRCLSGANPEQQRRIAQETQNIYAPLANQLGVWQLKWEMEDLSVRYLEPALYKKVAGLLDERRLDRERYIAQITAAIRQALNEAGIAAEVSGRPKHICSIINKMKKKRLEFSELYDVRAVRIMTGDIQNCYAALSVVHELWQPINSEFDDYIANPKGNGYRSLHTAVLGPLGLSTEVQIRTHDMHHDSELGVAAHWRYKENRRSDSGFDEKISWLRQILAWKDELADGMHERSALLQDRVYVYTPQGKVMDLPKGATPVDFAYALHTDLGHRTRGAKVDGSIVPLNYKLHSGQRVEMLCAKQDSPSRDWLSPQLGSLVSPRARAKVRHWFKTQNSDDSLAQGRLLFERELQRLGIAAVNQEKVAQRLHFHKLEELLCALGRNEITSHRVGAAISQELPAKVLSLALPVAQKNSAQGSAAVLVEGVDNLMITLAKCCNPKKPDAIVSYVTRDRGITLHRQDCAFMQRIPSDKLDRLLGAAWASEP